MIVDIIQLFAMVQEESPRFKKIFKFFFFENFIHGYNVF